MVFIVGGDFLVINQGCVVYYGDIIYEVGGQVYVVGNYLQMCFYWWEWGVVGLDNGGVMF